MEHQPNIRLSIIIPVHKGKTYFKRCLQSALQEKSEEVEILVVVDGDGDGAWKEATSYDVRIVKLEKNSGPATARNRGARMARGDILFFVDADVALSRGTSRQILRFFKLNPGVDAIIGSYDDEPGAPNFFSQYKNLFHHYVHQDSREEGSTFWGACGAIRHEKFLQLGGFNEAYRNPAIEDIDLGCRLKMQGGRIRLLKSLQIKHLKRWTCWSMLRADIFFRAIPWTALIWRNHSWMNDLNLQTSSKISVVLTFIMFLSFLAALQFPFSLLIAWAAAFLLFWINRKLYLFFRGKRGFFFAAQCLPWHWFYFLYCGIAFGAGTLIHLCSHNSPVCLQLNGYHPVIKSTPTGQTD